jgi:hypothetical protein
MVALSQHQAAILQNSAESVEKFHSQNVCSIIFHGSGSTSNWKAGSCGGSQLSHGGSPVVNELKNGAVEAIVEDSRIFDEG